MILRLSPGLFSCQRLWILWPCDFRLISHLSPSTLCMLCVLSSAWFRAWISHVCPTCLPVRSGCSECSGPHCMISHLSSTCLPIVPQYILDALSALIRMNSHLSSTLLPLVSCYIHSGFFARMILHWFPTGACVSHFSRCVFHFFVTCGLLVFDFACGRQQECQISNYWASDSGTAILRENHNLATCRKSAWVCRCHGSFCIFCGTTTTTTTHHQPPTTLNQLPPSTFAGSDLKYHEIRLIYKQTVWGQRWYIFFGWSNLKNS